MRLEKLMGSDFLATTIYGERFLNDTKGAFQHYSEVHPRYDPQGTTPYVDLPYTYLPPERCVTFSSDPSAEVTDWVHGSEGYRFFWHPDVARRGFEIRGVVRTEPTSSTRTLLTSYDPRVYIKTDLNKKHFRFVRRLQRSSVEHSVAVCADLRGLCVSQANTGRYAFLPESLGLVVHGGEHEGSGVIFREVTPFPHVSEKRLILPYHALYATDPNAPNDEPLLVQMTRLHGKDDPLGYFVGEIVGPLLEAWVLLVAKRGLLPELHGQNALAEIDQNLRLRRVVQRDFQGIYSDTEIRRGLGLPVFIKHVVGAEPGTTVHSQYSQVFDGMIGRYLLSRMSKVFSSRFNIPYLVVATAIKTYLHNLPLWDKADFPSTTYRFATPAAQQEGNDVELVDTGESPEFR